ncbi:response regulator [Acanthopleuribacter pedis]|uniref:Response regulator n=1 Tax=Acanthopleuribacter pedis TaxID=442870 RepID=A0A8J7QFU2_9BACT|nr:response regulator [Acanthopleuribacter pedis]MBO1317695.1 response regulator [Acanthopleuribacter pedis]
MNPSQDPILDELSTVLANKDLMKAKGLFGLFGDSSPGTQQWALHQVVAAPASLSLPLLSFLVAKYPTLLSGPFHAGIALEQALVCSDAALVEGMKLQSHEEKLLTLAYLKGGAGETRLQRLGKLLDASDDLGAKLAIIETLGDVADPAAAGHLAGFLETSQPVLREAALRSLRRQGGFPALEVMVGAMGLDRRLDRTLKKSVAEALNGGDPALLNQLLQSRFAALRVPAKDRLRDLGSPVLPLLVRNLQDDHTDAQIHSLNLMGEIGDPEAMGPIRNLLFHAPENANVRFAAYEAFAMLPFQREPFALAAGLEDSDESVRFAALKAINRHLDDRLVEGVRNILDARDKTAFFVMSAVIDQECGALFLRLIDHPLFERFALSYLATKAHPEVVAAWQKYLGSQGGAAFLEKLKPRGEQEVAGARIFAIDDSQLICRIYRKLLFECGHEVHTFTRPQDAIDAYAGLTPQLIFVDLNMPEMSGIEMTRILREDHGAAMPIVMVTTQNDMEDREAAEQAGVTRYLNKPFTRAQLEDAVSELVP